MDAGMDCFFSSNGNDSTPKISFLFNIKLRDFDTS
jgi:hypothetical protein